MLLLISYFSALVRHKLKLPVPSALNKATCTFLSKKKNKKNLGRKNRKRIERKTNQRDLIEKQGRKGTNNALKEKKQKMKMKNNSTFFNLFLVQVDNQNFKEFIFGLSVLLTTTFKQLVSQVVGQVESPTKNGLFALFPVDG